MLDWAERWNAHPGINPGSWYLRWHADGPWIICAPDYSVVHEDDRRAAHYMGPCDLKRYRDEVDEDDD